MKTRMHITVPNELVEKMLEYRCKHGASVSWQMRHFVKIGMQVEQALSTCGLAGIYNEFTSPTDAIEQMVMYIKERDDKVMPMDVLEME